MAGFQSPLQQQFNPTNFGSDFFQSMPQAYSTNNVDFMGNIQGWGQKGLNSITGSGVGAGGGGMFTGKSMFGGEGSTGWVSPVFQGIGGIMGGWNSMQQLDLAKDQFAFTKEAYQTNLANQTQLTNQQLIDRQTRRNIERPDMFGKADEQWKKENLLPSNK